jgi:hypothetical protein
MAVLDTSGLWSDGDDYRVIKVLSLPFGTFTQECMITSMNQLQAMSVAAQQEVLDLLADYDTADAAQTAQNLANTEGKTLVEADVLKWQVTGNGMSGPQAEKLRIQSELSNIFAFSTCLSGYLNNYGYGTTLIRS